MNHRLTRPGVVLIVLAQTTGAVQPPERPLDLPPVGQHLEGPQSFGLRTNSRVQPPKLSAQPTPGWYAPSVQISRNRGNRLTILANTRPRRQGPGCPRSGPRTTTANPRYQPGCAVYVLSFACPRRSRGGLHLGRLHGLAVVDGGAGAVASAGLVPDLGPQGVLDRLPGAIATPLP